MKLFIQSILRGLAILLPVVITIEVLRWLLMKMEAWTAPILTFALPEKWYLPGLGILSFLLLCFIIGFSARYRGDRKSTRLNSSHVRISYAVFCLKKKKKMMYE